VTSVAATPAHDVAPERARRARLRLAAFAPLCLVATLAWAELVAPTARAWALAAAALAAIAGGALLRIAGLDGAARRAAVAGLALALCAAVLLVAGVPARLLLPDRWGRLAADLADGLQALPGAPVPYEGGDPWVRIVVLLGGTLLAVLAALQALWPAGRGRAPGSLAAAALTLGVLYGVAVIQHPPARPYLAGAIVTLALGALLFAERLERTQALPAAALLVLAALGGAALAPALARDRPWFDVQHLADDIANAGTVTYDWNHSYAPLTWPRTGRTLLRIRAQVPAYWKAEVLDTFDGRTWRRAGAVAPFEPDTQVDTTNPQWTQTITVRDTALRSTDFVTAGDALRVSRAQAPAVGVAGGTYALARGTLRPGSSYRAQVYTPRPTPGQLEQAGAQYPSFAREWLTIRLPDLDGRPAPQQSGMSAVEVTFAPWGTGQAALVTFPGVGIRQPDGITFVRHSALGRIYALAARLRARASTPYAFVEAVQARVRRGARYTEHPHRYANPLDAFLFEDREGYCQHFSGAMALLLRMGGIPARVASGFSPGAVDRRTGEYLVSDLDAHSWVEAYFPHLGWITFDPTPAASPARAQTADAAASLRGGRARRLRGADVPIAAAPGQGVRARRAPHWATLAGGAALALLAVAGAAWAVRRRRRAPAAPPPADLAELERALRRSGRPAPPGLTLHALGRSLAGGPGGQAYLDALARRRFGGGGPLPTGAQRRALRRDLAAGLGRLGRLRALWALPPRPPALVEKPSARAIP